VRYLTGIQVNAAFWEVLLCCTVSDSICDAHLKIHLFLKQVVSCIQSIQHPLILV